MVVDERTFFQTAWHRLPPCPAATAAADDQLVGLLALLAGTAFGLAPRRHRVPAAGALALATPRTCGRLPFQRLRPALPIFTRPASALPTEPTVPRQSIDTRRISVDGRRSVANRPSFATSWIAVPAPRPSLPPAPGLSSTLCTVVPTG